MTKKQIEREVERWQKLLRLQDWRIKVKCIEAKRINDDGDLASVNWRAYSRRATITIARDSEEKELLDTIVHELLHIVMSDTDNVFVETRKQLTESANGIARQLYSDNAERAIFSIAEALVELSGAK